MTPRNTADPVHLIAQTSDMKRIFSAFALASLAAVTPSAALAEPQDDAITRALEMRARHDMPAPSGPSVIHLDASYTHYGHVETSCIVWRSEEGHWHRDCVTEDGPGGVMPDIPLTVKHETGDLTAQEVETLEKLLAKKSFYKAKVKQSGELLSGAVFNTMQIRTPVGETRAKWHLTLKGVHAKVAEIVRGTKK